MERKSKVTRKTKETDIKVKWAIDGEGKYAISTGIPFFDHMLHLFSRHGLFDLEIHAKGDTDVDCHHTVEDVGLAMGKAFREAIKDLEGLKRYGCAVTPMDESLCMMAIDISGRSSLVWKGKLQGTTGAFDAGVVKEFFKAFVNEAKITLHMNLFYGENLHHKIEAIFKSFGRALKDATRKDESIKGVLSTKGVL
jgi:imidazoleglycerol-phosphate dehydratase